MSTELKPCPACNKEVKIRITGDYTFNIDHVVEDFSCPEIAVVARHAHVTDTSASEAFRWWNDRYDKIYSNMVKQFHVNMVEKFKEGLKRQCQKQKTNTLKSVQEHFDISVGRAKKSSSSKSAPNSSKRSSTKKGAALTRKKSARK